MTLCGIKFELFCLLMTPGLSKDIRVHVFETILIFVLANDQIRYQATRKVGCQLGNYRWP